LKHFLGRGFNLEDTHVQDPERLSRLLALLALAFTWAFVVGLWQASVKELKLKKHGYPPKSIFRRGLNILCRLVTNFERFDVGVWRKVIKLLSCSYVAHIILSALIEMGIVEQNLDERSREIFLATRPPSPHLYQRKIYRSKKKILAPNQ
jgi:hypothetical protein